MSFQIGTVTIETELALGPMAGITDLPFRLLCKEQGVGLLYTEMVSAKGVKYRNRNTADLLRTVPEEGPIALQLFGEDPEIMATEAAKLSELSFDFFDINMGCPVPKVVNNGEGSALMKDPKKIYSIVRAMVQAQPKPVLVKMRKGFAEENVVDCAKAAEDAGASAVCVHGRLRDEYYSGHSDWAAVRRVKEAVKIPVIGSGDVTCGRDAVAMKKETGCDCVMIARAARGNPWIFRECKEAFSLYAAGREDEIPTLSLRPEIDVVLEEIRRHGQLLIDSRENRIVSPEADRAMLAVLGITPEEPMSRAQAEDIAMREMRKHVAWYLAGYPHSAELRRRSNELNTYEELVEMLHSYAEISRA